MEADGIEPEMPPIDACGYLVGYLFEVGPSLSGGMGPAPLTHSEIEAWQRNIGLTLEPFEARWLRRLSIEYLNESHRAEKSDCPSPYRPEDVIEQNRAAVARQIRNAMSAHRNQKG